MPYGLAGVLTKMLGLRIIFIILLLPHTVMAEAQKIGDWRLNLLNDEALCVMGHNGWGKNLRISYMYLPGIGRSGSISFDGLLVKTGNLFGNGSTLKISAPYSDQKKSFFYHQDAGTGGWGIASSIDDRGNFKPPSLKTISDFLALLSGGGKLIFVEPKTNKKVVSFSLSGNSDAAKLMRECLKQFY